MVCRNPKTAEEAKTEIINSTNNEVLYLEYLLKYTHSVYKMSCLILVLVFDYFCHSQGFHYCFF